MMAPPYFSLILGFLSCTFGFYQILSSSFLYCIIAGRFCRLFIDQLSLLNLSVRGAKYIVCVMWVGFCITMLLKCCSHLRLHKGIQHYTVLWLYNIIMLPSRKAAET